MWTSSVDWDAVKPPQDLAGDLMNREQTAEFLGINVITLDRWIKADSIPDGVVFNNAKRWSKTVLSNYVWSKHLAQVAALNERKSA